MGPKEFESLANMYSYYRRDDRHLEDLFSGSWRGPFEGVTCFRRVDTPDVSNPLDTQWRGPFEGHR